MISLDQLIRQHVERKVDNKIYQAFTNAYNLLGEADPVGGDPEVREMHEQLRKMQKALIQKLLPRAEADAIQEFYHKVRKLPD